LVAGISKFFAALFIARVSYIIILMVQQYDFHICI